MSLSEVGDAFEGGFASDEEFAREVAEGCGAGGLTTADLMENHVAVDGYYFTLG